MNIFFDCEFIENGSTIDLISIGMVREDGKTLYEEVYGVDWNKASRWVLDNVKPLLAVDPQWLLTKPELAQQIREFVGPDPIFWAYFCSYDWVALCQLYGTMMDLPAGWPMFCRDLKQLMVEAAPNRSWPKPKNAHNALSDARWVRDVHNDIMAMKEKT